MIRFSKEKVLLLHQLMAEATGGSVGVRDEGLLESALESALISNHAFVDGNKRIGMYIMMAFLEMNGIRIQCSDEELVHAGLSVADGSMGYEELLQWVMEHRT